MEIDGNELRQLLNDAYASGWDDSYEVTLEMEEARAPDYDDVESLWEYAGEPTDEELELGALIDAEYARALDEYVQSMSDADIRDTVQNAHPEGDMAGNAVYEGEPWGEEWTHPKLKEAGATLAGPPDAPTR